MNFIKKIFDGNEDESIHLQFQKFSKGEFNYKALIGAKKKKGRYIIKTTPEFANEMVRKVAKELGEEKTNIKGCVVSTLDLSGKISYKEIKQFQGVKRYIVDEEMSGKDILGLIEEIPKNFFALSFSTPDKRYELKIKPKAPKSGKPSSKGNKEPQPGFCTLKTTDKKTAEEYIFESPEFNEANIKHTFVINKLEIPQKTKDSGNYKKMREEAIRKGRIIREGTIDGKQIKEDKEFAV